MSSDLTGQNGSNNLECNNLKKEHIKQISNDPNFHSKLNFFKVKVDAPIPSSSDLNLSQPSKRPFPNHNNLSKSLTPPRLGPKQGSHTPKIDGVKSQSFHSPQSRYDFPVKRSSDLRLNTDNISESQDSDTDSSYENSQYNDDDFSIQSRIPRVHQLLIHNTTSRRVFVWDFDSERSLALTIRDDWDLTTMLENASTKLNVNPRYKYVYYKMNLSEIHNIEDIQNNDELILSCQSIVSKKKPNTIRNTPKKIDSKKRTLESPRLNRQDKPRKGFSPSKDINNKLERTESESHLFERILESQRKDAIERIRQRNLKQYDEVISFVYGTRIKKKSFRTDEELVRAQSLLDIKILESIPQEIVKSKSSNASENVPSSESNLSGVEVTDDDIDEEYEITRKEFKRLGKDITFDLEEPETKNAINPFKISTEEVFRRMNEEEQQDLLNIEIDEDGEVRAGTFRGLVRHLVSNLQSPEYIEAFLLTYDLFISHDSFLRTLILLYRCPKSSGQNSSSTVSLSESSESESLSSKSSPRDIGYYILQFRIVKIIMDWIRLRYDSLRLNKEFVKLFERFCNYNFKNFCTPKHKKLQKDLATAWDNAKKKRYDIRRNLHFSRPTKLENPKQFKGLLSIDPFELAQQLTVMEQDLFGRVQLSEYFYFTSVKTKSPRVNQMIKRFNKISFWTATLILDTRICTSSKQRGQTISHFIMVMNHLYELKNYNTMLQIFSALNMRCVSRLTKSWAHVNNKLLDILKSTAKLFESNYKEYRQKIEIEEPPCIPIQEVILRDLTFIEETNTILENGWINFEKVYLLGRTYKTLKKFQSEQYDFKSNNDLYSWALSYEIFNDEKLFDLSFKIQPSEAKKKEEKKMNKIKQSSSSNKISKSKVAKEECLSPRVEWVFVKDNDFMDLYRLPVEFKDSEFLEKFAKYEESLFAIDTLMYCNQIIEVWHSCDFKNLSLENIKSVKAAAINIYAKYLSETSDKALSLENPTKKRIKDKLVANVTTMLPQNLFDEITHQVVSQIKTHFSTFKNM